LLVLPFYQISSIPKVRLLVDLYSVECLDVIVNDEFANDVQGIGRGLT
jgi:hypothetical protein